MRLQGRLALGCPSCSWSCVGTPCTNPLAPGLLGVLRSPGAGPPGVLSPPSQLPSFANNETVKAERIQIIRRTFQPQSSLLCLGPLAWS